MWRRVDDELGSVDVLGDESLWRDETAAGEVGGEISSVGDPQTVSRAGVCVVIAANSPIFVLLLPTTMLTIISDYPCGMHILRIRQCQEGTAVPVSY